MDSSTTTLSTLLPSSTTTGVSTTTIWVPTYSPPFIPHVGVYPWAVGYDPVKKYGFIILAAAITTVFFLIAYITRYILVFYCECGPDPLKVWDKTYKKHMRPPPPAAVSDVSKENLAFVEAAPATTVAPLEPISGSRDIEMQGYSAAGSRLTPTGGRDTPTGGRITPTGRKSPRGESPRFRQTRPSSRGMDPLDYDAEAGIFPEEPHVHIESEDPSRPGRLTDIKVVDQFGRPASPMRVLQQRSSIASGDGGASDDDRLGGAGSRPAYSIQRPAPMPPIPASPSAAPDTQSLGFRPGNTQA